MGALAPLDAVADVKLFQDTFYPIQKEEFVRDGKTIAYLCGMTSSAMFYNKKLFDEAGLKPPTTYAELLDVAKKLTKAPNQYGIGIPTADQVPDGRAGLAASWPATTRCGARAKRCWPTAPRRSRRTRR